ncbi:aminotransferase class V-fold PLP-dependent enzyme [Arsenicitalea aurantiaca]|uniref:Cysteine desulfurase n=1 Tax=Arsenicitalea aurantiaca TaxID=1783274 RepID=A0A433XFX3_9HYPH|nr:aminotransferase class V-fold PLP-dependent enzyme [Arsenicitalea aurantiaca]RUT32914.1 aminotransferase class V-fold PLP-dependent enzyme [Arsenicitalea aurantiaca]
MSHRAIYLDHNASTPLLPEARDALVDALCLTGNPSSVHAHGRALRNLIERARDQVARRAGAERGQVVFTGSATEAITQAIVGGVRAFDIDGIIVSKGEHVSVLRAAESTGRRLAQANLDADGRIDVEQVAEWLRQGEAIGQRLLVAVHSVNGETGVVQPIEALERLVGPTPHVLFVDAVQSFGRAPVDFASRAIDMMAVSAHKIGGPAGVGALLVKGHADSVRLVPGGGQEQGRRGGTESAALIAAFGAATEAFPDRFDRSAASALGHSIESGLAALSPDAVIFGAGVDRIGHVVNFAVPGLKSSVAMMGLDLAGISVSSGSACASGKVGVSHVLVAMGVERCLAECALRVSLGWTSTQEDATAFLAEFEHVLSRHRSRQGQAA